MTELSDEEIAAIPSVDPEDDRPGMLDLRGPGLGPWLVWALILWVGFATVRQCATDPPNAHDEVQYEKYDTR